MILSRMFRNGLHLNSLLGLSLRQTSNYCFRLLETSTMNNEFFLSIENIKQCTLYAKIKQKFHMYMYLYIYKNYKH